MAFVTRGDRVLAVSAETAFDWLADTANWNVWTSLFTPVRPASGQVVVGGQIRVYIDGLPGRTRLTFVTADRPGEIAWRGGVKGVLTGFHRFLFVPLGPSECRVESVETWSGALSMALRVVVEPLAQRVGEAQLAGLPFSSHSHP